MASGSFAILDDVAMLLDDAAAMSKVAAKKTAGLLGDDLAVNAEKATGFHPSRELPVIWAITKGSLINKLIILPIAFLLSAFMPQLIVPILLLGGAYLTYEGAEKFYEWFLPHKELKIAAREIEEPTQIVDQEKHKIRSAVRTDFILSIEIVILALNTVIDKPLAIQLLVVGFIALLATVGVYGLVAMLVRMDDTGYFMLERAREMKGAMAGLMRTWGKLLVTSLPYVIRLLGVIGTIAMLLVGGGIYVHNIEQIHHLLEKLPTLGTEFVFVTKLGAEFAAGLVVGTVLVVLMMIAKRAKSMVS